MTFAPPTLLELAKYWSSQGGRNLGIVGDVAHAHGGTSYHEGKDDLIPGAYSATRPRDKAGLSNAASAIDFGRLDGSLPKLRTFSHWIVAQMQAKTPDTRDIVELVCADQDGSTWRGYIRTATGVKVVEHYGDSGHLTHTHISYFRDSESRSKLPLFQRYFAPPVEDNVQTFATPTVPSVADVAQGAKLHTSSDLADAQPITIDPGRPMPYYGVPYPKVAMVQYTSDEPGNEPTGKVLFLAAGSTSNIRPAPVPEDPTPYGQADLDAARDAGVADGTAAENARIGGVLGIPA